MTAKNFKETITGMRISESDLTTLALASSGYAHKLDGLKFSGCYFVITKFDFDYQFNLSKCELDGCSYLQPIVSNEQLAEIMGEAMASDDHGSDDKVVKKSKKIMPVPQVNLEQKARPLTLSMVESWLLDPRATMGPIIKIIAGLAKDELLELNEVLFGTLQVEVSDGRVACELKRQIREELEAKAKDLEWQILKDLQEEIKQLPKDQVEQAPMQANQTLVQALKKCQSEEQVVEELHRHMTSGFFGMTHHKLALSLEAETRVSRFFELMKKLTGLDGFTLRFPVSQDRIADYAVACELLFKGRSNGWRAFSLEAVGRRLARKAVKEELERIAKKAGVLKDKLQKAVAKARPTCANCKQKRSHSELDKDLVCEACKKLLRIVRTLRATRSLWRFAHPCWQIKAEKLVERLTKQEHEMMERKLLRLTSEVEKHAKRMVARELEVPARYQKLVRAKYASAKPEVKAPAPVIAPPAKPAPDFSAMAKEIMARQREKERLAMLLDPRSISNRFFGAVPVRAPKPATKDERTELPCSVPCVTVRSCGLCGDTLAMPVRTPSKATSVDIKPICGGCTTKVKASRSADTRRVGAIEV